MFVAVGKREPASRRQVERVATGSTRVRQGLKRRVKPESKWRRRSRIEEARRGVCVQCADLKETSKWQKVENKFQFCLVGPEESTSAYVRWQQEQQLKALADSGAFEYPDCLKVCVDKLELDEWLSQFATKRRRD